MLEKNKIKKIGIIILFIISLITMVFSLYNNNFKNRISLDKILDNIDNVEVGNTTFALMIQKDDGTYDKSSSTKWPTGMKFNNELSNCLDIYGNKMTNVLSYDVTNNLVYANVTGTAYCYVYFDIDNTPPQSFTFFLGDSSNPMYSTSITTSTYLKWKDNDVAYYCLTTVNDSSSCTWKSASGISMTPNYTFTGEEGEKIVYAFLKDYVGNVSESVSDTIILDTKAPVINSVIKTSDEKTSITINVDAFDETSGINTYYYRIYYPSGISGLMSSTNNTYTFTGLDAGTSYTIEVYIRDNAGLQTAEKTYVFETKTVPLYEEVMERKTTGYNTTMEGGLYRYQGTTANNYVCFGTSNKSTCLNNKSLYMYRIIGIDANNQIKLIKQKALVNTSSWDTDDDNEINYNESDAYKALNDYRFLNEDYYYTYMQDATWLNKIVDYNWKYGVVTSTNTSVANMYNLENSWTSTVNAKVGLMYLHDYYYSSQSGGRNCSYANGDLANCKASWLHLSNNDSYPPNSDKFEWLIPRYGTNGLGYRAWAIDVDGDVTTVVTHVQYTIRPVFFLKDSVGYLNGSGTINDPFLIKS